MICSGAFIQDDFSLHLDSDCMLFTVVTVKK